MQHEKMTFQELIDAVVTTAGETDPGALLLDLGCGLNPKPGFTGVDLYSPLDGVVKADLEKTWPFEDNSVAAIYTSHYIEHVRDWDHFWTEAHRVMKVGAYAIMCSPYYSSVRAFQDPDHKQAISEHRYYYLNRTAREQMHVNHYGFAGSFEVVSFFYDWHPDFVHRDEAAKNYAKEHYINSVKDIVAVLRKEA